MGMEAAVAAPERPSLLDRALRVFSDVRAGEGATALLMFLNLVALFVAYYVIRTVRDATILASGGAVVQSYASAAMAVVLLGFIPAYSWFASRVDRVKLIFGLTLFFVVNLVLFSIAFRGNARAAALAFFIWVGIFNNSTVAQFWSFANDLYPQDTGERLFPVVALGATVGAPLGSKVAEWLFAASVRPGLILQIAAALLLGQLGLYVVIQQRELRRRKDQQATAKAPIPAGDGFGLVFASPYLRLIAVLIIILNVVNTNGNFLWSSAVVGAADTATLSDPGLDRVAFIGRTLASFTFYQNILVVLMQAFLVSRIVKYLRMPGVLLALPLVALSGNVLIAAGAGFAIIRLAKMTENATDYSVMNTGRQMLWLPTRREEKYKAKQAIDTFFVRAGDVLSAGLVFGVTALAIPARRMAVANIVLVVIWLAVIAGLLRRHRTLTAETARTAA
jgi:AAA family ATP:ADP antiporter